MQTVGTVKSWFDGKGFGFIVQGETREDIFVHHTQIRMRGRRSLTPGQKVNFTMVQGERGLSATEVQVLEQVTDEKCASCGQELPK